jgi:DHA2 family multidrug resistance protein
MCRNLAGSIGIALSTTLISERRQANMAHLGANLNPLSQNYSDALAEIAKTFRDHGASAADSVQRAGVYLYQTLVAQATILAYLDMFLIYAILAFAFVPVTFLFSPLKAAGGPKGA